MLQNPQCCFVYYLVFKDQAACCFVATDSAIYLNRINLSTFSFGKVLRGFCRRSDPWIDPDQESRTVRYLSPVSFSCRFIFGCKELPCEVKLYNKPAFCCQCFFCRGGVFSFSRSAPFVRDCVYNKSVPGRQRLYDFIFPMLNMMGGTPILGNCASSETLRSPPSGTGGPLHKRSASFDLPYPPFTKRSPSSAK